MKNRFTTKQKRDFSALKDIVLPILIFGAVVGMFFTGLNSINQTTEGERLRSIEKAVTKATVQCYAVEGRYPPSLGYLEDHFGLVIDHDKYIVQYDVFATNLMPTILVMPVGFEAEDDPDAEWDDAGWEDYEFDEDDFEQVAPGDLEDAEDDEDAMVIDD